MKKPKCKYCKQEYTKLHFNQKWCLESECISKAKQEQWSKEKAKRKKELLTVQDYIKLAQQVFNKYIRLRDKGNVCISCQKPINGVKHASHYLSAGGHSNIRFHEDNVWVSCYKCNVMLSGNPTEYRKSLIKKIGIERVEWLENNSHVEKKWTIDELKEIIEEYKKKIKNI